MAMEHRTTAPAPGLRWTFAHRRGALRIESLVVLAGLVVAMSLSSPVFLNVANIFNVVLATSTIGILALGATYVIGSAGIDLSVGSIMAFAGVIGALLVKTLGLPWWCAIPGCLAAGLLAGWINGIVITYGKIPAFVVTLGMMGVARGVALLITEGQAIYGLPAPLLFLGQGRPFGIPMPAIVFVVAAVLLHLLLAYTRFGRHTLVIGDNERGARAMGVPVRRLRIKIYMLSGLMAGLAGLLTMARVNAGDPTAGMNFELAAITAAIIGGTNLFGGRATVFGTVIGALIMGVLQNGLNLLAIPTFWQQISIGIVLVAAVWVDQLAQKDKE
ncbi:ribose/xylose/arabinose/galactoside ABC-type transport system permease subunit [Labrys wisconsinensis]|uniref:Ribose/xylose/arabinose/galactoside ABC-type transport system permease subunit n=2 Tax=Labrys wisconsinensis TaxID=425677 RepID=A0ABU0JIM1_9HYPH|nr:ribose/xylose/arabinose/galactoside ABC-type transport system permease subunit [Labrys wisconsinensis]